MLTRLTKFLKSLRPLHLLTASFAFEILRLGMKNTSHPSDSIDDDTIEVFNLYPFYNKPLDEAYDAIVSGRMHSMLTLIKAFRDHGYRGKLAFEFSDDLEMRNNLGVSTWGFGKRQHALVVVGDLHFPEPLKEKTFEYVYAMGGHEAAHATLYHSFISELAWCTAHQFELSILCLQFTLRSLSSVFLPTIVFVNYIIFKLILQFEEILADTVSAKKLGTGNDLIDVLNHDIQPKRRPFLENAILILRDFGYDLWSPRRSASILDHPSHKTRTTILTYLPHSGPSLFMGSKLHRRIMREQKQLNASSSVGIPRLS